MSLLRISWIGRSAKTPVKTRTQATSKSTPGEGPMAKDRQMFTAWYRGVNQAISGTGDGKSSIGKKMPEKRNRGVTTSVK